MNKIKSIYKTELEYLKDGIKNSKNSYHTFRVFKTDPGKEYRK